MTTGLTGRDQPALKGIIMKTGFAAVALIVAPLLIASTPSWAEATREPVKAQLAASRLSGEIVAEGESGLKLNEVYPGRYAAK